VPLPRAFLSYAHADDDFLGGRIVALRDAIQKAVRFETGEPFEVFLDKDAEKGIQLGQDWQDRLDEGLAEARFLIPILSPSYFASGPCRDELGKFLELERRAGRKDLLLPILIRAFPRPAEGDGSETARLKRITLQRQHGDWSQRILEPFEEADGRRRIMALAAQIVAAISRVRTDDTQPAPQPPPPQPRPRHRLVPGRAFRDVDEPWCPEMVVIPAGSFLMGSPQGEEGWCAGEGPQHDVRIGQPFALGRHTVTLGEFAAFAADTGHLMTGGIYRWNREGWAFDAKADWRWPGFAQTDRHPVVGVSWDDTQAYCAWLSERTGQPYRLPSEAEWEYACRAGTTTPFWTGATISTDLANYDGNYIYGNGRKGVWRKATVAVDDPSFPANRFGLSHMHGNVQEWCEDVWHDDYAGAPNDGSAWTDGDPTRRVLRGGSWYYIPWDLRSASRVRVAPGNRFVNAGFRVARMLTP
jgi:formylglycine-generating enzyme required for sulfatase activity